MHGDDDRADGCRGEQQGDNFQRQHVAAHQCMPMSWTVTTGTAGLLRQGAHALEYCPAENRKNARGNHKANKPGAAEDAILGQFRAAREQNGEHNKDGDGADINKNLRKACELRVELQKQQRQPAKATVVARAQCTRCFSSTAARPPPMVRAARM